MAYPDVAPLVSLRIPDTQIVVSPSGSYFTQYIIEVVLIGYQWTVCKRYTQFLEMHDHLLARFPNIMSLLYFPDKTMFQMSKRVIEERRVALQRYILELASVSVPTGDEDFGQGLLRFRQLDDFLEVATHVCGPGSLLLPPSGPKDSPVGITTEASGLGLTFPDSPDATRALGLHSPDLRRRATAVEAEVAFPSGLPRKARALYDLVLRITSVRSTSRESKPVRGFARRCSEACAQPPSSHLVLVRRFIEEMCDFIFETRLADLRHIVSEWHAASPSSPDSEGEEGVDQWLPTGDMDDEELVGKVIRRALEATVVLPLCPDLQYRAMQSTSVLESLLAHKLANLRAIRRRGDGGLPPAVFGMSAASQAKLGLAGDVDDRWSEAVAHMNNMELLLLPTNQTGELLRCVRSLERAYHAAGTQPFPPGADEVLPILIYILILSSLRRPAACLKYIQSLIPNTDLCGELDYYVTMFQSALSYVMETEFDGSDVVTNPRAIAGSSVAMLASANQASVAVEDISLRGVDQSHFGLRRVFAAALGHPLFRRMEPEEAARLLCRDYIVELAICAQVNSGHPHSIRLPFDDDEDDRPLLSRSVDDRAPSSFLSARKAELGFLSPLKRPTERVPAPPPPHPSGEAESKRDDMNPRAGMARSSSLGAAPPVPASPPLAPACDTAVGPGKGWRWILHPAPLIDPQYVLLSFLPLSPPDKYSVTSALAHRAGSRRPPSRTSGEIVGIELNSAPRPGLSDAAMAELGLDVDEEYLISLVQHVLVSQRAQTKFYFQVYVGDGDVRWDLNSPERMTRCRKLLGPAGTGIDVTPAPRTHDSLPSRPSSKRPPSKPGLFGDGTVTPDATRPRPGGTILGRASSSSDLGSVDAPVLPGRYDRCNESSWRDQQLEWYGPVSSLEECVLACQAYFELGGREGAEKVSTRRDLLDMLL